jgi:heterodisulfide reductase subunit B
MAAEAGAAAFVSACPMCTANLDTRQTGAPKLPVLYNTEILAVALQLDDVNACWAGHGIDPRPLLRKYGVLSE